MAYTKVVVQTADFDAGKEAAALLAGDIADGALVTFTGLVRGGGITAMELEHYPEMTEKSLRAIVDDARRRWPVLGGRHDHSPRGETFARRSDRARHCGESPSRGRF